MEKPLRFERMSGLDEEQLNELECRVARLLERSWAKDVGRPHELSLREALVVTCGYLRQNIVEDVWADIFDVDQSTVSRYITLLTPLVEKATQRDRPGVEEGCRGHQGCDRAGRWDAVAVLVLGRRGRAVGREVQDHRARFPDCYESSGSHHVCVRAGPRQPP